MSHVREKAVASQRLLAMCVSMLACLLIIVPATAVAHEARLFAGSFGGAASSTVDPYPLSESSSMAVDDVSHDVYVTDPGNHRVQEFSSSGEFIRAFGANVGGPGVNVCGGLVSCSAGTPGSAPGELTTPEFVAVDNSGGPSAGYVYVGDKNDNVVSKFNSSGELVSSWGVNGQLDGSGVTSPPAAYPGPFVKLGGVSVDPAGDLWVRGQGKEGGFSRALLFEFKQDGTFVTDWQTARGDPFEVTAGVTGALYFQESSVASEYNYAGEEVGPLNPYAVGVGFGAASIAADQAGGHVYVGISGEHEGIAVYGPSCHPKPKVPCEVSEVFGGAYLSTAQALAVDSGSSTVYAVEHVTRDVVAIVRAVVPDVTTSVASSLSPSGVTLNGTVNPDGVALKEGLEGCRFEWDETTAYGHTAPCDKTAAQIGTGASPVEVHASIAGLTPGSTYHFRLVAGNANDVNEHVNEPSVGKDVVFGPPVIESESVSSVSSTSATVEGEVDRQNADTSVQFEYGTSVAYGQSTPAADVGAGASGQQVSEHLQGLLPGTVYHYRVSATSVLGAVQGDDHTFTTQPAATSSSTLPDGRQWELVSPPDKHGASFFTPGAVAIMQAASSGNGVSFPLTAPTEAGVQGFSESVQVLSSRNSAGGWSSRDISVSHAADVGPVTGYGVEYRAFSTDLAAAIVEPEGPFTTLQPEVFPPDSERTPYLRDDATCTSEPGTCYAPIATGAQGYADVTSGVKFGGDEAGGEPVGKVNFVGASPDLKHVIVSSAVQLTSTPVPGGAELYEWSADKPPTERLELVSRIENGEASPEGAGLGFGLLGEENARGAVSSDGSRVFWGANSGGLFVRDLAKSVSLRLDVPRPGVSVTGQAKARFQGATSNGRVFFIDEQRLTENSGASAGHPDLYTCELVEEGGALKCPLVDLSPASRGESADVQKVVTGFSNDGSWVYFVANGVLGATGGEGAKPGSCEGGLSVPGATCNLYVVHNDGSGWGAPRLVAVLSGDDFPDWGGSNLANLKELTASVSGSGEWLAFMSDRSVTGYDNRDAFSGKPDEEVFLYHANTSGPSSLVCVSCDPTGARPVGVEYANVFTGMAGGSGEMWPQNQWLAATLPGFEPFELMRAVYQPRFVFDSGRVFFNSGDALVPQDINHDQSVYEYEPAGAGGPAGCSAGSPLFVAGDNGCVGLVSSGTGVGESVFVDASETGDDVFFLTAQKLTGQDIDSSVDLYDAHVCTNESPCLSEPSVAQQCTSADACRAAASLEPEVFGAPASTAFSGNGNLPVAAPAAATVKPKAKPLTRAQKLAKALKACRKDRNKRKRSACERNARKRFKARNARHAVRGAHK